MNCNEARDRFSPFLDGELTPVDQIALTEHLGACERCRVELRAIETSLADLRSVSAPWQSQLAGRPSQPLADAIVRRVADRPSLLRLRVPAWAAVALVAGAALLASMLRSDASRERPVAERMRDEGFVDVGGHWVPSAEVAQAHDGQVFRDGRWVPVNDTREDVLLSEGFVHSPDGWEKSGERDALLAGRVRTKDGWTSIDDLRDRLFDTAGIVRLGAGWIDKEAKAKLDRGLVPTKDGWKTAEEIASAAAARHAEPTETIGGVTLPKDVAERIAAGEVLTKDGLVDSKEQETKLLEARGLVLYEGKWIPKDERDEMLASAIVRANPTGPKNAVTAYLDGLRVGNEVKHGLVSLFPLSPKVAAQSKGVLLSDDVAARLEVAERERELRVNTLRIRCNGESPVLIQAGTVLRGGNQDRLPAHDVVVWPGGGWQDIEVYCCEAGRWTKERDGFEVSRDLALPSLRRLVYFGRPQTHIWDEVKRELFAVQAKSASGSLRAAYDDAGYRKLDEEYEAALSRGLSDADEACGVAVAVGDQLLSIESYGSPALFRQALPGILRGLSLQALAHERGVIVTGEVKSTKRAVKFALEEVFSADFTKGAEGPHAAGLGVTTRGGFEGQALSVDGKLSHLVLFAPQEAGKAAATAPPEIGPEKVKTLLGEFERAMTYGAPADRLAAIAEFSRLGIPGTGEVMAKYLGDASVEVRIALAQAIGARGEHGPVKALLDALDANRKEPRAFEAIAVTLARIGDERAIEPFTKLLQAPDDGTVEVALSVLPPLVLRSQSADKIEDAVLKLIGFAESLQVYENQPNQAVEKARFDRLSAPALDGLAAITGQRFPAATAARLWWTRNKKQFLKDRSR